MIEEAIVQALRQEGVEPLTRSSSKYKLKFIISTKDQGGQVHNTKICVRIMSVRDNEVCVEFLKLEGDKTRFVEHYLEFKNKVLDYMNDCVEPTI